MSTIGVDLGATNLRIALYSPRAGVLKSLAMPTRVGDGPDAVVEDICDAIRRLLSSYQGIPGPVGIGIGSPGPLELPAGRLHHPPNLPGWNGFNLLAAMETRQPLPVFVDGDANAAVLAEYRLGSGKQLGLDSLCILTLGTGVGSGMVLNGEIWHGTAGMAAEAGHLTINPEGPLCGCGNNGCLETYASATALINSARRSAAGDHASGLGKLDGNGSFTSADDLATAARKGNVHAQHAYEEAGRALGIGIADLVNMLNLPLYVIGGGVAQSWDLLSPALFSELRRRSYVYRLSAAGGAASSGVPGGGTRVLPAKLGSEAGLLGACLLPLQTARGAS